MFEVSGGQRLAWRGALADSPEDIQSSFELSVSDTSFGTADVVSTVITVSLKPEVGWTKVTPIVRALLKASGVTEARREVSATQRDASETLPDATSAFMLYIGQYVVHWQVGAIILVEVQTGALLGLVSVQKLRPGPLQVRLVQSATVGLRCRALMWPRTARCASPQVLQAQPTMFDNCLKLSERHRLRWSLTQGTVPLRTSPHA
jgi:hypothetical protein